MRLEETPQKDLSGYIVIACKMIRPVVNIELLNYVSQNKYDDDIEFFLAHLDGKIYETELDFEKADKIRIFSRDYLKYQIHHSTDGRNIGEKLAKLNTDGKYDDLRPFEYIFLWESEDMVTDYESFRAKLQNIAYKDCQFPGFCETNKLKQFLKSFEEYGDVLHNTIWISDTQK
ncbi:MAG: hypothetical protein AAF518_01265 [Spirochaetota bacterium]